MGVYGCAYESERFTISGKSRSHRLVISGLG